MPLDVGDNKTENGTTSSTPTDNTTGQRNKLDADATPRRVLGRRGQLTEAADHRWRHTAARPVRVP